MELKSFTVGPFAENTYLLTDQKKSVLIDPGFFDPSEFQHAVSEIEESDSELIAVLLTHAHVDHILGLDKVLKKFDVPVYLNHTDLYLWNNFSDQAMRFGFRTSAFDFTPEPLPEQKGFSIGPFTFDVLYTPGHAPDHVALYFSNSQIVLAGDALFRESIGRTDLYKGDFELLSASIQEKLYTLPDETTVYPGHGPSTTIGHEKKNNGFVKG
jgi:hydroxyacylglutathione hydrolase